MHILSSEWTHQDQNLKKKIVVCFLQFLRYICQNSEYDPQNHQKMIKNAHPEFGEFEEAYRHPLTAIFHIPIFLEKSDVNLNLNFDCDQGWEEGHNKDGHHNRFGTFQNNFGMSKKLTPRLKYKCLDSQILMGRKKLRLLWKRRRMLLRVGTTCSKIGSGESCLENDKENMDGHNSQGGERNRTFK